MLRNLPASTWSGRKRRRASVGMGIELEHPMLLREPSGARTEMVFHADGSTGARWMWTEENDLLTLRDDAEVLVLDRVPNGAYRHASDRKVVLAKLRRSPVVDHQPAHDESGIGSAMKMLLSWFGHRPTGKCKCNKHVVTMNRWTAAQCWKNAEVIIGWLNEEATARGITFYRWYGYLALATAIALAKAKLLRSLTNAN